MPRADSRHHLLELSNRADDWRVMTRFPLPRKNHRQYSTMPTWRARNWNTAEIWWETWHDTRNPCSKCLHELTSRDRTDWSKSEETDTYNQWDKRNTRKWRIQIIRRHKPAEKGNKSTFWSYQTAAPHHRWQESQNVDSWLARTLCHPNIMVYFKSESNNLRTSSPPWQLSSQYYAEQNSGDPQPNVTSRPHWLRRSRTTHGSQGTSPWPRDIAACIKQSNQQTNRYWERMMLLITCTW